MSNSDTDPMTTGHRDAIQPHSDMHIARKIRDSTLSSRVALTEWEYSFYKDIHNLHSLQILVHWLYQD